MNNLEESLFLQLAFACSETRQAFDQLVGMSQPRRQLLMLVEGMNEVSHAVLQGELGLDGATVTRLVKQFEAQGILVRRLDPADNRYTLVSLTSAGQQMVAGLKGAHTMFQTKLLNGITRDEQETVVKMLEQLRNNIRSLQEGDQE